MNETLPEKVDCNKCQGKGLVISPNAYSMENCDECGGQGSFYLKNIIETALSNQRKEFVESIENLDEMIAVIDNDSHRYQIPKSKQEEWGEFCNIPEDDERSWDVPDFAERIDGMPVDSFKEKVLALLSESNHE